MEVLCIGLAVMDISARPISRDMEWQEKQSISEIGIQLGGDAVNQGVFLKKLGMDCGLNICILLSQRFGAGDPDGGSARPGS